MVWCGLDGGGVAHTHFAAHGKSCSLNPGCHRSFSDVLWEDKLSRLTIVPYERVARRRSARFSPMNPGLPVIRIVLLLRVIVVFICSLMEGGLLMSYSRSLKL